MHGRQNRFSKKDLVKVYGKWAVHSQDGYQIFIFICENLMFNLICCSYPVAIEQCTIKTEWDTPKKQYTFIFRINL